MKSIMQRSHRGKKVAALAGMAIAVTLVAAGCSSQSSSSGSSSGSKSALTIGELFPFTGSKAQLSTWGTHGVATGIYEINHNGGVLGHKFQSTNADDAADAVDAVPALRKLLLDNPVMVVGPFSPTIMSVINNFGPSHVVDFMIGGSTQLDHMQFPYVFRTTASDSTEAAAMAYYAVKEKGYKTASLMFDNSANSQGFVDPLTKAFEKLGGTVQQNITIVPNQGSYRSELVKAFSGRPQVTFMSFDTQTATTLFADAKQLGYLDSPWIGDDLFSSKVYAQAFGPGAPQSLYALLPTGPSGQAYDHFLADYKAVYPKDASPLPTTFNEYDAIVIGSLAMTEAKSTDPKVWVKHVVDVATPPGTMCYTYASCVKLINAGKQINYEGAGGNNDFNQYHNVFSGFTVEGFNSDLSNRTAGSVSGKQVAESAG